MAADAFVPVAGAPFRTNGRTSKACATLFEFNISQHAVSVRFAASKTLAAAQRAERSL